MLQQKIDHKYSRNTYFKKNKNNDILQKKKQIHKNKHKLSGK